MLSNIHGTAALVSINILIGSEHRLQHTFSVTQKLYSFFFSFFLLSSPSTTIFLLLFLISLQERWLISPPGNVPTSTRIKTPLFQSSKKTERAAAAQRERFGGRMFLPRVRVQLKGVRAVFMIYFPLLLRLKNGPAINL